jgi:hypothetical protein
MSDNKLFSLLNSLTGVEKRELHHFLESPFFNRRAEVVRLWEYLLGQSTQEEDGLPKEKIFEAVFPGEVFDDGQLRYLFTYLREKIEWFLAYRQWDKTSALPELALSATYRERGLEKHFLQAWRRAEKQAAGMQHGLEKSYTHFKLASEQYFFSEKQKRTREGNLQAVHDSFDEYVIIGKLRLACLMAAQQKVVKMEYDHSFLPLIIHWLENSDQLKTPAIGIYYHCYLALTENDESHFQQFRQLLEKHGSQFDPEEIIDLLLMAVNFCIRQVNVGKRHFIKAALDLYKLGLQNDLLTAGGQMSRFTYKNIVALALALEEFGWAERFIADWQPKLEERYQESSYHFNLAKLYFTQKDYARAMPLLAQVDDSDFLLMLDAKVLLLKMYYETGEWDALDSLLASFKTFLRRKKQIGYHEEHYKSLLRYTSKLLKINRFDRVQIQNLRGEISKKDEVLEKDWLLGQLGA